MTTVNEIIIPLLTAILTLAGFIPWHNAQIKKLRDDLPKAEPFIEKVVNAIEAIIKIPFVHQAAAELVAPLQPYANYVQDKEAELIRWATTGLHGFGRLLGTLSDTEKAALAEFIRRNCGDPSVATADILAAINKAQAFADAAAGSDLFKNAVTFTQTIQDYMTSASDTGTATNQEQAGTASNSNVQDSTVQSEVQKETSSKTPAEASKEDIVI